MKGKQIYEDRRREIRTYKQTEMSRESQHTHMDAEEYKERKMNTERETVAV